jgi:hypothetical protein
MNALSIQVNPTINILVVRCDFGDWDVRKAVIAGKLPRLIRYTMKMWDEARIKVNELAREGKNVTRWTMIIDLNNFNVGQHLSPQGIESIGSFKSITCVCS